MKQSDITEVTVEGEPVNIWHPDYKDSLPYDGFSISYSRGGWMPGIYDSIESAKEGARMCFTGRETELVEIKDRVNNYKLGNRAITLEDLGTS